MRQRQRERQRGCYRRWAIWSKRALSSMSRRRGDAFSPAEAWKKVAKLHAVRAEMSRRLTPARPSTSTTRDNAPTIQKDANSIPQNREKDSKPDDPNDLSVLQTSWKPQLLNLERAKKASINS